MACTNECRAARGRHAHCGVCHKTFAGLTVFDDHRKDGACVEIGLTEKNGVWGNWGTRQRQDHWRPA